MSESKTKLVRGYIPRPLFCHSKFAVHMCKERKFAFGKFGPEIAEHIETERPVFVNDHMPESGLFDYMTDKAAEAFARNIIQVNILHLLDEHSPMGEPPPPRRYVGNDGVLLPVGAVATVNPQVPDTVQ